ncbi:TetR/AcrR family transcriptional regulator [Ruminiclostridium hungatei]|nr:TetR/AcrR family transcriptional regulator [Ruminiclostridium hungatei]
MSTSSIREPRQKRSIEKKKRIVDAGFKLFCEKGYYNTNTAEIAKEAGVSTGIVYNYFNDKKDIFIAAVKFYSEGMTSQLYRSLMGLKEPFDMLETLDQIINIFTTSHTLSKEAHEEMMAMSHTDNDVREYFCNFELTTAEKIVEIMFQHGIKPENAHEKVHIAMGMIENFSHEVVYHKHEYMNYDVMKKEIIRIVAEMMNS